jgi:hypothetical protein
MVQRQSEWDIKDATDTDPSELSRGISLVRKDQTTANETHEHRGNRDRAA